MTLNTVKVSETLAIVFLLNFSINISSMDVILTKWNYIERFENESHPILDEQINTD